MVCGGSCGLEDGSLPITCSRARSRRRRSSPRVLREVMRFNIESCFCERFAERRNSSIADHAHSIDGHAQGFGKNRIPMNCDAEVVTLQRDTTRQERDRRDT